MSDLKTGAKVTIAPLSSNVALGAHAPGRMLDGPREVAWSAWWASRLRDGDIRIVPASPIPPPPAPVAPKSEAE